MQDVQQRPEQTGGVEPNSVLSKRVMSLEIAPAIVLAERAAELRRNGVDAIGLAVGELDFDTPDHIIEAAHAAAKAGFTRYTAPDGAREIKQAVQQKLQRDNGFDYSPAEIHIASGCKQVIYNGLAATINPGDEVVIITPCWGSYIEVVKFLGGTPVILETTSDAGFIPDAAELARVLSPKTKWVILNSPNNPTGAVYSRETLGALADVIVRFPNVMVMSDEIYEHLIYDNFAHHSIAAARPEMRERTLIVNGVSKSYAMTGWRMGFGAGPSWLISAMAKVQSQTAGSSNSIGQAAAAEALTGPQSNLPEWRQTMERRRDAAYRILGASRRLKLHRPNGAFYMFVDVSGCVGARTPQGEVLENDTDIALYLLEQGRVATVPGSAFGRSPFLRVSFADDDDRLATGCRRICEALDKLS